MDWILNKLLNIQNFLEFYIVNGITWKYNINQMSSKIAKMTGIIGKARYYIPRKCLLPLYTMVYPYLSYCKITWTCTYPTRLQSIFITQKKLVRIMTFSNYRESSKHLFTSSEINKYFVALFVYSFFNNKLPSIFEKKNILTNDVIHSHNTRAASKLYTDYKRTNYGKFSTTYRGADI